MRFLIIFLASIFVYSSCQMPEEERNTETSQNTSVNSHSFQIIKELEFSQDFEGLYQQGREGDIIIKTLVVQALQSQGDDQSVGFLKEMMGEDDQLDQAICFALGQKRSVVAEKVLMSAFKSNDTFRLHNDLNGTILESIGKTGTQGSLVNLANVRSYYPKDTALLRGQILGLYQFALRGMTVDSGTAYIVKIVSEPAYPNEIRVLSANYLKRVKNTDLTQYTKKMIPIALNHKDPYVRMSLIAALGKSKSMDVEFAIEKCISNEKDYRVIVNAIRVLPHLNKVKAVELAKMALKQKNLHIRKSALGFLADNSKASDGAFFYDLYKELKDPELKAMAGGAANKLLSWRENLKREKLNSELKSRVRFSEDSYEKVACLNALSYEIQNFRMIQSLALNSKEPVVKSSCVAIIGEMLKGDKLKAYYGAQYSKVVKETVSFLESSFKSGDAGMIAVAAGMIRDEELQFGKYYKNISLLSQTMEKLSLPKEIESYNELERTIAFLKGEEVRLTAPKESHKMDWEVLDKVSDSTTAEIVTTKGRVTLKFFTQEAPHSVANFIYLAKTGFYDHKAIHRVVPNFVIQSGCPRGDGYGSLNYTLNSEFSQRYYHKEGMVGMASAGKNTEGTQWFITHSPTPHLDGKYTIFAEVIEGMNIVHGLRIGDHITSVEIKY